MGGFLQREVLSYTGRQGAWQVKSLQREFSKGGVTLPGRFAYTIPLHLALF